MRMPPDGDAETAAATEPPSCPTPDKLPVIRAMPDNIPARTTTVLRIELSFHLVALSTRWKVDSRRPRINATSMPARR
jgi:hypothetical protein